MIYWTSNNCNTSDVTGGPFKLSEEQGKFYLNPFLTDNQLLKRESAAAVYKTCMSKGPGRVDKARQHSFLNT